MMCIASTNYPEEECQNTIAYLTQLGFQSLLKQLEVYESEGMAEVYCVQATDDSEVDDMDTEEC